MLLARFWQALEQVPGAQTSAWEWRILLGDCFPAILGLLSPTSRFADALPDPEDPYSFYGVVRHLPSDIVGVHDRGKPSVKLTKQDVAVLQLNRNLLMRMIADAFGIDCSPAPTTVYNMHCIGVLRPRAGFSFPAYLALPLQQEEMLHAVRHLAATATAPYLVFAPTSRMVCAESEALLADTRSLFVSLQEILELGHSGKLRPASTAAALRNRFVETGIPQLPNDSPNSCFPTPVEATWDDVHIRFSDGHTVRITVGEKTGTYSFDQMGMRDGRSLKPNVQWTLLAAFAKRGGRMDWNSPEADRKLQKRREKLAGALKAFFRLDDDPIEYDEKAKGWRTRFHLEPDNGWDHMTQSDLD